MLAPAIVPDWAQLSIKKDNSFDMAALSARKESSYFRDL